MACKSPEAIERKRIKQKEIKREFREKMKSENRKPVTIYISHEAHDILNSIADTEYPERIKGDSIGNVVNDIVLKL